MDINHYIEQLEEIKTDINCFVDYLVYKHTYPYSAFTLYCNKTKTVLYEDNFVTIMSYEKWKDLFKNKYFNQ